MSDCIVEPIGHPDQGYVKKMIGGVRKRRHRWAWEFANGPIPEGMIIDHLCRNRACYNVEHLRLVTHVENITAPGSQAISQIFKARTHCNHGHEFTPENTLLLVNQSNSRRCKTCARDYQRRYWAARHK